VHTFEEVGLEVDIEDVATQTLDRVIKGQDVDAFSVLDVEALVDIDEIAELDAEVVSRDLVHLDAAFLDVVGAQADEHGVTPFLATR
jgi:hypothetical protein